MTFETWVAIVQLIFLVVLTPLVKSVMGRLTDRMDAIHRDCGRNERDVEALQAQVAKKIDREEWTRETARIRITLERIAEGQARIEGRIDTGVRMAQALERLVERDGNEDDKDGRAA